MKHLMITCAALLLATISQAQTQRKDTVMVDSTQVEEIKKMPMDTTHHNMPVSPLQRDSIINRRSGDDVDPKKNDPRK